MGAPAGYRVLHVSEAELLAAIQEKCQMMMAYQNAAIQASSASQEPLQQVLQPPVLAAPADGTADAPAPAAQDWQNDDFAVADDGGGDLVFMLDCLVEELSRASLSVNARETKIMTTHVNVAADVVPLFLDAGGRMVEVVKHAGTHKYFGRLLSGDLRMRGKCNLEHRMKCAWLEDNQFADAMQNRNIPITLRLRLFDSLETPSVLHSLTTSPLTQKDLDKLDALQMKLLRRIVGWVLLEEAWQLTGHRIKRWLEAALARHPVTEWSNRRNRQRADRFRGGPIESVPVSAEFFVKDLASPVPRHGASGLYRSEQDAPCEQDAAAAAARVPPEGSPPAAPAPPAPAPPAPAALADAPPATAAHAPPEGNGPPAGAAEAAAVLPAWCAPAAGACAPPPEGAGQPGPAEAVALASAATAQVLPAPTEAPAQTAFALANPSKQRGDRGPSYRYTTSGDPFYPAECGGTVYDSFNLRIVFERDRTGFEECKEFPIYINSIIAARYQVISYLGSAAFSRAIQCFDLHTQEMVCMKIIKNEKDFVDQSLDEIKLLKLIGANTENVDDKNVLRMVDCFYHKEHLIIVTELLRDNLYEFSRFNRQHGDEPYFTLGRLQRIMKQLLVALEYIHSLWLIRSTSNLRTSLSSPTLGAR
ncbi:unnamed protein product [Prorocentrum cordatum]|uniref:Protein kinase domain-containing protein n=1 Tax=Prorocentrum cordatum TaxID=2364126 RepID=A0ABN9Y058_9DINO|nr:unnamed protein product [Polarella glacialis]